MWTVFISDVLCVVGFSVLALEKQRSQNRKTDKMKSLFLCGYSNIYCVIVDGIFVCLVNVWGCFEYNMFEDSGRRQQSTLTHTHIQKKSYMKHQNAAPP